MQLKPANIWSIFDNAPKTLEAFCQRYVPDLLLRKEVSQDVVEEYEVIRKLLLHSYYEYKFIDVAMTKLLHTFEMALKIRFREVNESVNKVPNNLQKLISWFRERNYFEVSDESYFNHIRQVRNIVSHPERHSFGGTAKLHWFNQITDLINDLYADLDERIQRQNELLKVNNFIADITKKGAILSFIDQSIIVYDVNVFYTEENRSIGYYRSIFKPSIDLSEGENRPINFGLLELENYEFKEHPKSFGSGLLSITEITDKENSTKFDNWRSKVSEDFDNTAFDSMIGFKIDELVSKKRREAIHSKYF